MAKKRKTTTRRISRKKQQTDWQVVLEPKVVYEIVGAFCAVLGALSLLSLLAVGGVFGQFLKRFLLAGFGIGSYVWVFLLFVTAIGLLLPEDDDEKVHSRKPNMLFGAIITLLASVGLAHVPLPIEDLSKAMVFAEAGKGGGIFGFFISYPLRMLVGEIGNLVVLVGLLIIGVQIGTGFSWGKLFSFLFGGLFASRDIVEKTPKLSQSRMKEFAGNYEEVEEKPLYKEPLPDKKKLKVVTHSDESKPTSSSISYSPIKNSNSAWLLPAFDLLRQPKSKPGDYGDPREKAKMIEQTLASFGVSAQVIEANCGPSVTQFAVKPAVGVRVSRILNLHNDLALALSAPTVRIEAPIPSRPFVGIEIPNASVRVVTLRELLETEEFAKKVATSKLQLVLGRDVSGKPVIDSLEKMPHLLVAGATGSGKSVCSNTMLCSLLYQCTPQELKMILIDPKVVELTAYNGIPHLLTPVITDPVKTLSALKWAIVEMERRYQLFAESGARNLKTFNAGRPEDPLPFIVILIEEFADLMMVAPSDVENAITRLAQKARATGIHLICSTQRPSADVITGLIKANIPARIAFTVASQIDSRVILDTPGAEKLLGQGDMLFLPPDASRPKRVQGAYVSDDEINKLMAFLKEQGTPEFSEEILTQVTDLGKGDGDDEEGGENFGDDVFQDALEIIMESGKASTSYLQRRLKIGYSRAARIMDLLEEKGVISPGQPGSSRPRDVHIAKLRELME
ncbi:MAG: DNA translocase FtsK 4TM domain-containing protein [bacterium]